MVDFLTHDNYYLSHTLRFYIIDMYTCAQLGGGLIQIEHNQININLWGTVVNTLL